MGKQTVKEDALTVTLRRAADLLGISYYHMYLMVKRGDIPVVKLGRAWRVSKKAIERIVEGETPN